MALFVLALAVRVAANRGPVPLAGDAGAYETWALSLLQGKGYMMDGHLTSFKPPAYPAFLTGVYGVFGHHHRAVVLVQSVLGALTCVLTMAIGCRFGSELLGLWGGLFAAFSPALVRSCGLLLSEPLAVFLLTSGIWLGICLWQDRRRWQAVGWGACMAALVLTRSAFVAFPLVWWAVGVAWAARGRNEVWPQLGRRLSVGLMVCLIGVGLWSWRNWRVHRAFVPVSTDGGVAFYSSYRPPEGRRFGFNAHDALTAQAETIRSEVERDRFYYPATVAWIQTHLEQLPRLILVKLALFCSPWDWELIGRDGKARYHWLFGLALPFMVVGGFAVRRFSDARWLWLPVGYALVLTVVYYGSPRLRMPFEPSLLVLAAVGIDQVMQRCRSWRVPAGLLAADVASNAVLVAVVERVRAGA